MYLRNNVAPEESDPVGNVLDIMPVSKTRAIHRGIVRCLYPNNAMTAADIKASVESQRLAQFYRMPVLTRLIIGYENQEAIIGRYSQGLQIVEDIGNPWQRLSQLSGLGVIKSENGNSDTEPMRYSLVNRPNNGAGPGVLVEIVGTHSRSPLGWIATQNTDPSALL